MSLTLTQLRTFIAMRNKSPFPSNLQFTIDLMECGIGDRELGPATFIKPGLYEWATPFGTLIEQDGQLRLMAGDDDISA